MLPGDIKTSIARKRY